MGKPAIPTTRNGTWERILKALQLKLDAQGSIDWEQWSLDGTIVRAHRATAGAPNAERRCMHITIRPAVPDDAEAIARLNAAFDDLRATPEHIASHLRERSAFERGFVAEVDGAVAGIVCLRLLPCLCDPIPSAELTELFVDSAYRRCGIGRYLVQRIEAEARAAGADKLVLMTAWRNTEAHAFYHALGYRLYTITMQRSLGG